MVAHVHELLDRAASDGKPKSVIPLSCALPLAQKGNCCHFPGFHVGYPFLTHTQLVPPSQQQVDGLNFMAAPSPLAGVYRPGHPPAGFWLIDIWVAQMAQNANMVLTEIQRYKVAN